MQQVPQIKSGFLSSEFALSVGNSIAGIAVMLGYLPPAQADQFSQAVVSTFGGIIVIVSTVIYVWGRVKLKQPFLLTPTEPAPPSTPTADRIANLNAEPAVYPK